MKGWDIEKDEEHYPKTIHDNCRNKMKNAKRPAILASSASFEHLRGDSPPRKKQRTTCYVENLKEPKRRSYMTEKKVLLLKSAKGNNRKDLRPSLKEIKMWMKKKCQDENEDIIEVGVYSLHYLPFKSWGKAVKQKIFIFLPHLTKTRNRHNSLRLDRIK